jgi:hypothetical protein
VQWVLLPSERSALPQQVLRRVPSAQLQRSEQVPFQRSAPVQFQSALASFREPVPVQQPLIPLGAQERT